MKEVYKGFLKCIHPLGIAIHTRTQKRRLICDARHANEHLVKTKFKMEALHIEGRALFQGCDYGGTCDISQAYYHIDMHESAWPYLGFEWEKDVSSATWYCPPGSPPLRASSQW